MERVHQKKRSGKKRIKILTFVETKEDKIREKVRTRWKEQPQSQQQKNWGEEDEMNKKKKTNRKNIHQEMYYIILVIGHYFVYNIIFSCWNGWFSFTLPFSLYPTKCKILLSIAHWSAFGSFCVFVLCLSRLFIFALRVYCFFLNQIWLTPIFHFIARFSIQCIYLLYTTLVLFWLVTAT